MTPWELWDALCGSSIDKTDIDLYRLIWMGFGDP